MLYNILNPLLSPLLMPLKSPSSGDDCRYYYNFDGDHVLIPTLFVPADFEVYFMFSTATTATDSEVLIGDNFSTSILLNVSTSFSVWIQGVEYVFPFGASTPRDMQPHSYRCVLESGMLTLYLDGISLGTTAATYTPQNVNYLIASSSTISGGFTGKIWDVSLSGAGVVDRSYAINDNSNIIVNSKATLGSEVVPVFDYSQGWQLTPKWYFDSGIAYFDNLTSPVESLSIDGVFEIGRDYLLSMHVESSHLIGIQNLSGTIILSASTGSKSTVWTADTERLTIKRLQNGATGFITLVSAKMADGYGELINENSQQWEEVCTVNSFTGEFSGEFD